MNVAAIVAAIILAAAAPVGLILWLARHQSNSRAKRKLRAPSVEDNPQSPAASMPPGINAAKNSLPSKTESPDSEVEPHIKAANPVSESPVLHPMEIKGGDGFWAPIQEEQEDQFRADQSEIAATAIPDIPAPGSRISLESAGQYADTVETVPPELSLVPKALVIDTESHDLAYLAAAEPTDSRDGVPPTSVQQTESTDLLDIIPDDARSANPSEFPSDSQSSQRVDVIPMPAQEVGYKADANPIPPALTEAQQLPTIGIVESTGSLEITPDETYCANPSEFRGDSQTSQLVDVIAMPAKEPGCEADDNPIPAELTDAQLLPAISIDEGAAFSDGESPETGAVPLYRPAVQRSPRRRAASREQKANPDLRPTKEVSLDIRVRLLLSRTGVRDIAFLPVRSNEIDEDEVHVKFEGNRIGLVAQEDWYQDLRFDDSGKYLRQGIQLRGLLGDGRRVRWLLSGRSLYVLASHPRATGFVSTSRLMLGRPHVVLCTPDLWDPLEEMLRLSGCRGYSRLSEDDGVPEGWIALRDVNPTQPILSDLGDDLRNATKPTPDLEIDFEGGICLGNQDWLAGYPPKIKLYRGPAAMKLFIDGKEAQAQEDGFFAEGYDEPGAHTVSCEGVPHARTYTIIEPPEDWNEWPAYSFRGAEICGPLVRIRYGDTVPLTVPMTNPLLIGAEPGQVFRCSPRRVTNWKGYVPFDPVWALPAVPFVCNKKTSRIIQLGTAHLSLGAAQSKTGLWWSTVIMNSCRKGLQLENPNPEARLLWSEYKEAARKIWRATR